MGNICGCSLSSNNITTETNVVCLIILLLLLYSFVIKEKELIVP
jgi:hypothetical protein